MTILTKYVIIKMVEEDHSCINYTAPPAIIHCPGNAYFMQNQDSLYITRNKIDDPLSPIALIRLWRLLFREEFREEFLLLKPFGFVCFVVIRQHLGFLLSLSDYIIAHEIRVVKPFFKKIKKES